MIRNKSFINFICAISITTVLLVTVTGKTIPISALAVGPLADPVYDTDILAFKDYVEANLDASQLDIMFFLIGGLAVAQMGAQDAMLISPYPNEENVKEWIINCGIQLYNSVIGLVPEGDYYMGIPSIGTGGQKGVPRQVIKALVAQMMGDAVVAINYPDLDTFLEDNPGQLLLPFNADLQLGVNAIFGLNGGLNEWQYDSSEFTSSVEYIVYPLSGITSTEYANYLARLGMPTMRQNQSSSSLTLYGNIRWSNVGFVNYENLFINYSDHTIALYDSNGVLHLSSVDYGSKRVYVSANNTDDPIFIANYHEPVFPANHVSSYIPSNYTNIITLVDDIYNGVFNLLGSDTQFFFLEDFVKHVYYGTSWNDKIEIFRDTDLNLSDSMLQYYQQVTQDYLFDLRGLMGDLVNYVYLNPIWDNIYDIVGTLVTPDRINVSVDLTPITDLLAPPLPVNLNDIDLYTDNNYLTEIKQRSQKFGETLGEYFVFWHNSDPMTVYVIFGSVIVILIGAFIGKWGHS